MEILSHLDVMAIACTFAHAVTTTAFIPPPLLPQLSSTTLPRIICCAEPPPSNSPLTLALSAAPVAVGVAAGAPVFAAVYLPLLAIGLAVEASPAAILFLSTLLFAAGALLVDDIPNIVAVTLANGGKEQRREE